MPRLISIPILTICLFTVTYAVNLQSPLYPAYALQGGAAATSVTVAFAAYVGGLMPTLLLLGGLSDRIGRRYPIALALCPGIPWSLRGFCLGSVRASQQQPEPPT